MYPEKEIVTFDVETTGKDRETDEIIEISLSRLIFEQDGISYRARRPYTQRIRPRIPISAEASAIHGITEEQLLDCPYFEAVAHEILSYIEGADLSGYNINQFDVPVLFFEFQRAGIEWNHHAHRKLDVCGMYKQLRPRNLAAALKDFAPGYLWHNRPFEDAAHGAEADVDATEAVLWGMFAREEQVLGKMSFDELVLYSNYGVKPLDVTGKFAYAEDGVTILLNFGKHKGEPAHTQPGFLQWMLGKGFPADAMAIALNILKGENPF